MNGRSPPVTDTRPDEPVRPAQRPEHSGRIFPGYGPGALRASMAFLDRFQRGRPGPPQGLTSVGRRQARQQGGHGTLRDVPQHGTSRTGASREAAVTRYPDNAEQRFPEKPTANHLIERGREIRTMRGRICPTADDEMLRAAEKMESDNPLWIIVFGVYSRQFVAFPRFNAPKGTMAVAGYPPALTERMRAIERAARRREVASCE
jgi:hypothetical protein